MAIGILEVKLGRPIQMPTKRFHQLLRQARRDCCKARNAAMLHWYVWRREHADWEPGKPYEAPKAKIMRTRKPAGEGKKPPKDSPIAPRLFLSRELYHAATAAARNLSASLASSCVQEVIARLKANTPYDHDGEARWVWQAILASEVNLPTWRGGRIPMPKRCSSLGYDGAVSQPSADVARACKSGCVLKFQLLSRLSGYRTLSPIVRLDAADLTRGNRRLLRRLASGEVRLADSQIVEKKGKWFAQFCYEVAANAIGLPTDQVLTLLPAEPDDKWPFALAWTKEDGNGRVWKIGNGRPLVAEYRRVVARRRAIRYRYQDGTGSGHGRQRWYKAIRPMAHAVRDMQNRFEKQTIADIIKLAIRERCGTVLYREPTMPVRNYSWFAAKDVPFDWTSFEARLRFKTETRGLAYEKARIGMKEWRPRKIAN